MNIWDLIKTAFAILGTTVSFLLGGWDIAMLVLIVFLCVDFALGTTIAVYNKTLNSKVGFKGLAKKVAVLAVIVVAGLLDRLIGNETLLLRSFICYFYIANEGISILENVATLGVPIPQKIIDILGQLRKSGEPQDSKK